MNQTYKLVFRGEVLDGQHPAVVRKRLAEEPGFGDEQLDKLFSGRPVIVKREADSATAARFQAMFRKAGARLRVVPVDGTDTAEPAAATSAAEQPAAGGAAKADAAFELLPPGSDVLRAHERTPFEARDVDTGALALEGARFSVAEAAPRADSAPDVSHLSLAEAGTDLGEPRPSAERVVAAPELEVAVVGADLGAPGSPARPTIDVDAVTFEVAPAGADLDQRKPLAARRPPDTSHLTLE